VLVAGHGTIVAEFFDSGHSRTLPWARRPQAAALVATLADPDRGWDAIVIGEYEGAFYASQYASMVPLFQHYGVSLWLPEVMHPPRPKAGPGDDSACPDSASYGN
jgi:site-specific DNA recombinase